MSTIAKARDHFYDDANLDNVKFKKEPTFEWEFRSHGILIFNDSLQDIIISFDGESVDGVVKPSDRWIAMDKVTKTKIWLKTSKSVPAKSKARVMAWRGDI